MQKPQASLCRIALDQKSLNIRSTEVAHEREVAIGDLLDFNRFALIKPLEDGQIHQGPFVLKLSLEERRKLVFDIHDENDLPLQRVTLSLSPFRKMIKDYFVLCESYFEAVKTMTNRQIETIDMARRGIHNEGAQLLRDLLEENILVDKNTARRLFTLISVLHITG